MRRSLGLRKTFGGKQLPPFGHAGTNEGDLSEPTASTRTLHLDMPLAGRPTFDAAEPRPIKDFILFRCRAIFHAEQASQFNPEADCHVADADAQVVAPAA